MELLKALRVKIEKNSYSQAEANKIMDDIKNALNEVIQNFKIRQTSYNLNYHTFINELNEIQQDIKSL